MVVINIMESLVWLLKRLERETSECLKVFCSVPKQSKKYGVVIPNVVWKKIRKILNNLGTVFHLSSEFGHSMLLSNFA